MHLYSERKAYYMIGRNRELIESICQSYALPASCLKAILMMELQDIRPSDYLADALVSFNWLRYSLFRCFVLDRHTRHPLRKFDSSTGYGQIFSQVAIEAILFAQRMDIPLYLGISGELFPFNPDDLRRIWRRLRRDRVFNLSCAALNLLHSAFQMTGETNFNRLSEDGKKMTFSRYNGNAQQISPYGEQAYRYYLEFEGC